MPFWLSVSHLVYYAVEMVILDNVKESGDISDCIVLYCIAVWLRGETVLL